MLEGGIDNLGWEGSGERGVGVPEVKACQFDLVSLQNESSRFYLAFELRDSLFADDR